MGVLAVGLHWYTFHTGGRDPEPVMDALGGAFSQLESRGGFGQPCSYGHESGTRVYCGSKREDQPVVVHATGEVCETFADELVKISRHLNGVVTRVDVALDLEPASVARRRLAEMRRAWLRGQVETRMSAGSHEWYQSEMEGEGASAYFGGKTAALRLCAYDRRGPLRLEWRLRPSREVGEALPKIISRDGAALLWRRCALGAIFPMQWYRDLLKGPCSEWTQSRHEGNGLLAVIEGLREQFGVTLWGLQQLGVEVSDLAVEPERPRGEVLRKFMAWCGEASEIGYDGGKLKRAVLCKSKSRRVRV